MGSRDVNIPNAGSYDGDLDERVSIRPAGKESRALAYRWLYRSDKSPGVFGYDRMERVPVPTEAEFIAGYDELFFDGSAPERGRYFIVFLGEAPVGVVGYCADHMEPGLAEIDVWLDEEARCGRGIGTRAVELALARIEALSSVVLVVARVSRLNLRAQASFAKAGFTPHEEDVSALYADPTYLLGDTGEGGDVFLVRRLRSERAK